MESKERAPAIVVMEIGNCITIWDEVLLGIEEEGIPFAFNTFRQVKLSIAPGWLLVNLPCWLALPAIRKN